MIIHDEDEDYFYHDTCPNCGREYDAIDMEYQICHYCKHHAPDENIDPETIDHDLTE